MLCYDNIATDVVKTILFWQSVTRRMIWDHFHSNSGLHFLFLTPAELMLTVDLLLISQDWYIVSGSNYILNPCEERNILLLRLATFTQIWVLTPVQRLTLYIWPTQQLQGWTSFSVIILIYAYKSIQKILLLEFVQGYIGHMS